jgi:hypothetical protein
MNIQMYPDTVGFAAVLVAKLGLSQRDQFLLGTALITASAEEANAHCPDTSPFVGIEMDHDEPFKVASACLLRYDTWNDEQIETMVAAETAALEKEFEEDAAQAASQIRENSDEA